MDSITESSLISTLECPNSTPLYHHFSNFLHPFSDFISLQPPTAPTTSKTKKTAPKKKTATTTTNSVRPLAKQFLPFLSRILKIIPSRLASQGSGGDENTLQLLKIYRLALDCLSCISPCLAGTPHSVHLQRALFLKHLEACRRYSEAEAEGFSILESLQALTSAQKTQKSRRIEVRLLPELPAEGDLQPELAALVVEVVVSTVSCVFKGGSKEGAAYQRVLDLVGEVAPWFRVLNSESFEKFHPALVKILYKCALFLVGEPACFDGDLVHRFCMRTLAELLKSSMKDQFPKFARRICSSISLQWEGRHSLFLDILRCALESISCECKVQVVCNVNDVLDFLYYCSDNCRIASVELCRDAAKHLKTSVSTLVASILDLYTVGLCFVGSERDSIPEKRGSRMSLFLDNEDIVQCLASFNFLASYFHTSGDNNGLLSTYTVKKITDSPFIDCGRNIEVWKECKHIHGDISIFSYLNALDFLCKPFAEYVNTTWKHIVTEKEDVPLSANIKYIQDAFHQFCNVFLNVFSIKSEGERERWHESRKTFFHVTMAAFRISLMSGESSQKSMNCIDCVISREWIQLQELKFLTSSLYNIGVSLYNAEQLKKASMAFALCHRSLWAHVSLACQKFPEKRAHGDYLSEEAILEIVADACAKSAMFLDVLHQCGNPDMNEIIVSSLLNWSSAVNMLKKSVGPMVLVKQWVKIVCKDFKDASTEDNTPSLYSLLSRSGENCSETTLGVILEQELLAYEEMDARYPNLCRRMQLEIINTLLCYVYIRKDSYLQRSRLLVKKGRLLRACGVDCLNSCIQCLSEAISILNDTSGVPVPSGSNASYCHQLALTYCLRALCTQEVDQNSEVILQDVNSALKLWTDIPSHFSADDHPELMTENAIPVLCHISDLLSLKGYFHIQYDIYKTIIILYKRKNVPLERCLSMLWADRRLNHALCISPICETFLLNIAQQFGVPANSVDFWMGCMDGSPPLLLGFCQKLLLFDSFPSHMGIFHSKISMELDVTVDKVREAASNLISSIPVPSHSAFLAGYLYHDLCERLLSSGQLLEALSYAKEALRLRTRLLNRKFVCFFGLQSTKVMETKENTQQSKNDHVHIQAIGSVVTEIWPDICKALNIESTILTPWNVLKCFLESALQVGIVLELIGNGAEAEAILLIGKKVSCLQGLPPFGVAFASFLGRIYHKRQQWDMAESELDTAKQILVDSGATISCKRCKLIWEVIVDMQIANLSRSRLHSKKGHPKKKSSQFLGLYESALEKLNLTEQGNHFMSTNDSTLSCKTIVEEADNGVGNTLHSSAGKLRMAICNNPASVRCNGNSRCSGPDDSDTGKPSSLMVNNDESHVNVDVKKSKKSKNTSRHAPKKQTLKTECNLRITRASNRSSHSKIVQVEDQVDHELAKHSSHCHKFACPVSHSQRGQQLQVSRSSAAHFACEDNEHGFMQDIIYLKLESHRRRLLLRLLRKIGKCTRLHGDIHEVHKIFWQSIYVLLNRKPFCEAYSDAPDLIELIEKENPSDIFAIERAAVLYDISWFTVKNFRSNHPRKHCCYLSDIPLSRVVTWLFQAFILCRELPTLFAKVSRLLATIFVGFVSAESISLPLCTGKALSASHWAAYFHQASVGSYIHYQYLSSMKGNNKSGNSKASKEAFGSGSGSGDIVLGAFRPLRYVPEKLEDLEGFVTNFFDGLPCVRIVCISLLGGSCSSLIGGMLLATSSCPAWILLSRFHSMEQPDIMLLPVDLVVEENLPDDGNYGMESISGFDSCKRWVCPWGHTLVDDVAPQFRSILEENHLSTSMSILTDTQKSRSIWWTRRTKLNDRLDNFLRSVERSWLGPWRCLLVGDHLNCERLDVVVRKLKSDLKSRCKFEVQESILKAVVGGAQSLSESEVCVSQLLSYKGYLGRGGCCGEDIFGSISSSDATGIIHGLAYKLILEAVSDIVEESTDREPVVLVLDANVQMLPWENLPILRKQEVYRMPSVISISVALNRSCGQEERVSGVTAAFPSIDPCDAYYLLNPSGDLSSTQVEFEDWFRTQKWEGKAGSVPPTEELTIALQNHDLFIYLGHGSGMQYIPGHEIQKLDRCAATLLMGCSSGSLSFTGCYAPQGAPLSYILAGSPAIIANLWDVTDKDIDRFAKVMLDAWLQEESACTDCPECNHMVEEFRCLTLAKGKANVPKSKKNALKVQRLQGFCNDCKHRNCGGKPRIASFMSQARDACRLPFLIGASPVCYGVPTVIRRLH